MSAGHSEEKITRLGELARSCLTSGRGGKVLAAVSGAIYLLTDANELLWITTEEAPMHRRCLTITSSLPKPEVGSPFYSEEGRLIIDAAFVFDTADAFIWNAPHLSPRDVLEIGKLPAHIHSFFSDVDLSQAKGFGNFIPLILSLSQNVSANPPFQSTDPILLFAQPLVMDMAHACLERNAARISQTAEALIGLGSGLTPSGDDFLGGMLFAINILQTAYLEWKAINHAVPIEAYQSRTHLISFTLLKDNASGHGIASLHQIINDLLSGKSFESIYPSLSQLTQVGHSTGWDLLTGLLTGMLIIGSDANLNSNVSV